MGFSVNSSGYIAAASQVKDAVITAAKLEDPLDLSAKTSVGVPTPSAATDAAQNQTVTGATTWEKITSGQFSAATSLTLSSISTDYDMLRFKGFFAHTGATETIQLQFNDDTGNNYAYQTLTSASGAVSSAFSNGQANIVIAKGGNNTAYAACIFDILLCSSDGNTYNTIQSLTTTPQNATTTYHVGGSHNSTTAISKIKMFSTSNFRAGGRYLLEGWKA